MMLTFQVKLHTSLAMVAQIRGTNRLQFLPQMACKSECPVIQLTLLEGEIGQYKKKKLQNKIETRKPTLKPVQKYIFI